MAMSGLVAWVDERRKCRRGGVGEGKFAKRFYELVKRVYLWRPLDWDSIAMILTKGESYITLIQRNSTKCTRHRRVIFQVKGIARHIFHQKLDSGPWSPAPHNVDEHQPSSTSRWLSAISVWFMLAETDAFPRLRSEVLDMKLLLDTGTPRQTLEFSGSSECSAKASKTRVHVFQCLRHNWFSNGFT
jgi:hypothetical protein